MTFDLSFAVSAEFSQLLVAAGISSTYINGNLFENWGARVAAYLVYGSMFFFVQLLLVPLGWKVVPMRFKPGNRLYLSSWVLASHVNGPFLLFPFVLVNCLLSLVWEDDYYLLVIELGLIVVYPLLAPPLIGGLIVKRRALRLYPKCVMCGFNLRGNTSGRCPECGNNVRGTYSPKADPGVMRVPAPDDRAGGLEYET